MATVARPQPESHFARSDFRIGARSAAVEVVAVVVLPYLVGGLTVVVAVLIVAALLAPLVLVAFVGWLVGRECGWDVSLGRMLGVTFWVAGISVFVWGWFRRGQSVPPKRRGR